MRASKAHRVFSRVGVPGGQPAYAPGYRYMLQVSPVVDSGIKHHMPVGPCDGCPQVEGSVSTVPIMTVHSISSCSKSATVVSTQSSTAQHEPLSRPFHPAIQANSAPRCSVCPGWHQMVSSRAPRNRTASQSVCLRHPSCPHRLSSPVLRCPVWHLGSPATTITGRTMLSIRPGSGNSGGNG